MQVGNNIIDRPNCLNENSLSRNVSSTISSSLLQCRLVGSDLIVVRLESTFGLKIVPAGFNPRPKELSVILGD